MSQTEVVYGLNGRRDFSGLTEAYLFEQYQTKVAVGGDEAEVRLIGDYFVKSSEARKRYGNPLIIPYSNSEPTSKSENLRVFKPENPTGDVAIIIGGGYWRIPAVYGKQAWNDFPANGLLPHGVTVINVDYPVQSSGAQMPDTVASLQKAISYIYSHADELGINKDKLHLIGHSAGGQLAALMTTLDIEGVPADAIKSMTSVSGVPDIGFATNPLCHLRQGEGAINITEDDAANFSPTYRTPKGTGNYTFLVGAEEPFEFQWQSETAADRWGKIGANSRYEQVDNSNHYTLFGQLSDPHSYLTRYVLEQMEIKTV